ncbi:alpha-glucosidase [Arcanobacterium wilhelmae]|uniref:Alpha-glucosidase n=1 Tax=Arcanobacterium wilhelmae TaxID=1803177 RepID=A0ABT9NAW4_9ACTO|nr:alpha-amylase family glycosyl hydrolase [Arcanobacterium wilhelmae]MDP9800830.1 alpha-glucosidase [Arcanobacterium wilhelmae]WFN90204.1 alpha-amylase family glycosyl hydrolase [Arcanobacterium wilhelmae]
MTTRNLSLGSNVTHDASDFYVERYWEGEVVHLVLRIRFAADLAIRQVRLRTLIDGEPRFIDAYRTGVGECAQWWQVEVASVLDVFAYRWIVTLGDDDVWVNAEGAWNRTVPDHADFRCQLRGLAPGFHTASTVYQIFPDRFARSAKTFERGLPQWSQGWLPEDPAEWHDDAHQSHLFGGDFWGVIDHLDDLQEMGVTTLYFTPFFEARSSHRYDAHSFDHVDPALGGDEALIALAKECHARGMRLIGDLTTNHTGVTHEWFVRAQANEHALEREFYYFSPDGTYASWLGVPSLPKLNYSSRVLRERLFGPNGVVRKYLQAPFNLDGWRIDVANMTARHDRYDSYRSVMKELRAVIGRDGEKVLIAEHAHDFSGDIDGTQFHGSMNYAGFTRPMWEWLARGTNTPALMGSPATIRRRSGREVVATMEDFNAQIPWQVRTASFNLITSHDTCRITDITGSAARNLLALAACYLLPGVPMVLYGEELGLASEGAGLNSRVPIPWERIDQTPVHLQGALAKLARLRAEEKALAYGALRWVAVSDDVLVFAREHREQTVYVCLARDLRESVEFADPFVPAGFCDAVVGSSADAEASSDAGAAGSAGAPAADGGCRAVIGAVTASDDPRKVKVTLEAGVAVVVWEN